MIIGNISIRRASGIKRILLRTTPEKLLTHRDTFMQVYAIWQCRILGFCCSRTTQRMINDLEKILNEVRNSEAK